LVGKSQRPSRLNGGTDTEGSMMKPKGEVVQSEGVQDPSVVTRATPFEKRVESELL